MKNIYFLFVLLSGSLAAQQITIKGFLKDALTNEPIISASVGVKNTAIGTVSNEEGNFQLSLPKSADVVITYLGYKTVNIPAASFDTAIKTLVLEPDEQLLEEVVVSKVSIDKFLKTLITSSIARFNKPIMLHTYYREFVKVNGQYSKFSDGLLDYHISGSTKKNKSDLIVKQSRTAQLFTNEEVEEESVEIDSFVNVLKGVTYNYDFTFVKDLLLEDGNYNNYELEIKSRKDKQGKELYAITFEPKEGKGAVYKGSITYDPETKLIFDIDVDLISGPVQFKERNFLIARVTFMNSTIKAVYKMSGNNYVLAYANRYNKLRITMQKRKFDKTIESKSDMVVTDLSVDDLSYNKKEIYKAKDLYSRGNHYTDKFWLKNNSMVLTAEEQKIIERIEKEQAQ